MDESSYRPSRQSEETARIRIGVSACLLGERVRYDGGHKRNRFVAEHLRGCFELIPVCPEVAIGMGVPREPIRLVASPRGPRAVGTRTPDLDVTDRLAAYGRRMARELEGISGYVFKSKSPSCGMERVRVYGQGGSPSGTGRGIYAAEIVRANPMLPVEEEGRLDDPALREGFLERVYAYRRWQELIAAGVTAEALARFHARHKLVLMAHGQQRARELGRLVAEAGRRPVHDVAAEYGRRFMVALSYRATRRRHANVLFHAMGYLKRVLDGDDKAELAELIHDYREGRVPLTVPVTLLRHHFRRHPDPYMEQQIYFAWRPTALHPGNDI